MVRERNAVITLAAQNRDGIRARMALMYALMDTPAAAIRADAIIRNTDTRDPVRRTTVEALAGAATPQAQKVLTSLMADGNVARPIRVFVVGATVGVRNPLEQLL